MKTLRDVFVSLNPMRNLFWFIPIISFWFDLPAQNYEADELLKSIHDNEKSTLISDAMNFTPREYNGFWPVHKEFEMETEEILNRKLKLIENFVSKYEVFSDDEALAMIKGFLELEMEGVRVREVYFEKFQEVIPPSKVARFYQLENLFNAKINSRLIEMTPLIKIRGN